MDSRNKKAYRTSGKRGQLQRAQQTLKELDAFHSKTGERERAEKECFGREKNLDGKVEAMNHFIERRDWQSHSRMLVIEKIQERERRVEKGFNPWRT